MLAVTLLCVWLGFISHRANKQRRTVETIKKAGGWVAYDYEADEAGWPIKWPNSGGPPPGPEWLRNLIGIDYFADVAGVGIEGTNEESNAVLTLPRLRGLDLVGPRIDDSVIARLKGTTELRYLSIRNTSVSDAGWEPLAHLHRLKILSLFGSHITDSTLLQVRDLTDLTNLTLVDTQISDFGLEHLTRLCRLHDLWLDGEKITDSGLQNLKSLTSLRFLNIDRAKVTDAGVQKLKKSLPGLEVSLLKQ